MNSEVIRLSQEKVLEDIKRPIKATDMLTVYLSHYSELRNLGILPVLIPIDDKESILQSIDWNFHHGDGKPESWVYHDEERNKIPVYDRFGNDKGLEPLIIEREFHGIRESYLEIAEEFRLFHNLYHDPKTNTYIKFSDDGEEQKVATVEPNCIKIRAKEIQQFLSIKEMYLSIQFDHREHSRFDLNELGLEETSYEDKEDLICWGLGYGEIGFGGIYAFSRLLGKYLIPPYPKSKSGSYGFSEEQEEKYLDFIIDTDDAGDEVTYNSNPGGLANFFGANPEAPNYLTPVYFNKKVLDRYYSQPSKYSVEDSYIRCGELWGMQIDNHHEEKICVWLGDLGRDLPYRDQLHWRAHNILPEGKISETYYKRQLMAQPSDSTRPEHNFKTRYNSLAQACSEHLTWQILLPLDPNDSHHFDCLRVPATNEQKDFDDLILGLTKILIDSLNEKELNKFIPSDMLPEIKGSISRLAYIIDNLQLPTPFCHIDFLKKLQALRSSSSAHRKGSTYKKIAQEFNIDKQDLREVFVEILLRAISFIDYIENTIRDGYFSKKT